MIVLYQFNSQVRFISKFILYALASLALDAQACAQVSNPEAMTLSMRKLRDDEIRELIVGKAVSADSERTGVRSLIIEYFYSSRQYERLGERGPSFGTYRITDDRICIDTYGSTECKNILVDNNGRNYFQRIGQIQSWPILIDTIGNE